MKLTNKLTRDALIFLVAISLPAYFFAFNYIFRQSEIEREQTIIKHLQSFQGTLSEALWNGDYPYTKQIVNTLSHNDGVVSVDLFDETTDVISNNTPEVVATSTRAALKNKIAAYFKRHSFLEHEVRVYTDNKDQKKSIIIPLSKMNNDRMEKLGAVHIVFRYDDLKKQAHHNALVMIGVFLIIFGIFLLFEYLYLRKLIIKPLSDLEEMIGEMNSSGDIRLPVQPNHIFEIASLTHTFNKMGEDLQNSTNIINTQQMKMINVSKMSSLGEMASGVAHEINNPLMITRGFLDKIQKIVNSNPEKYADISLPTEKAINGVLRVAKIVTGLRSFARNGSNDPMQSVELEKILSETLELCFERFKHGAIKLETTKAVSTKVFCRESQISQVVLNLLNNAFDAVADLDVKDKWVKLEVDESKANKLIIRVIDCGCGIPEEVAKKMLEPFFTTKETGRGTGLGLSISVGIIEDHNGKLYLDATHPNTCFVIELPV